MKRILILAGSALLSLTVAAAANTITIDSISGSWGNVTGTTATGEGTDTISWGGGTAKSSYEFDAAGVPIVDPASPFFVGNFTHNNVIISPPSITGAELTVGLTGNVDGVDFSISSIFGFSHDETTNSTPCQSGSVSVCDDIVSLVSVISNGDSIMVGDDEFFFQLTGFAGGVLDFFTEEGKSNTAGLFAEFTTTPGQIDMTPVPLPASALLLLGGVGGLAALRRRKRAA